MLRNRNETEDNAVDWVFDHASRIHDLLKLARLAKLDVSTEQAETLSRLSFYYLETRYPEQIADMANNINKEIAGDYLTRSQELLKWLRNKLSLET